MLTLSGINTYTGATQIEAGTLALSGVGSIAASGALAFTGGGVLDVSDVTSAETQIGTLSGVEDSVIHLGSVELTITQQNDSTFAGVISDCGASGTECSTPGTGGSLVKGGTGTLTLSGTSIYTGTTTVNSGTLDVTGSLLSAVTVQSGATLSGTGTIGSVTVADGGIIAPGNPIGTLTVTGDLILNQTSQLHYEIGAPGTAGSPGASDRIAVGQNLTLDGQLHLFDDGGAGIGYYRLMTYGGLLTDNTLDVVTPGPVAGATYTIQSGGGNVDLVISSGGPGPGPGPIIGDPNLQYWQDASPTWTAAGEDWRNDGGEVDVAWAGNHGVFSGPGGTIDVVGAQSFRGLQFVTDGYVLGGSGTLQTEAGGSELRVLAGETATIGTVLAGSGGIDKTQGGTLILTGANSYTGATTIGAGTLALQGAGSIASSSGLAFTGAGVFDVSGVTAPTTQIGTLSGVAGSEIRLGATGLDVAQAAAGTYGGAITGTGGVSLTGPGVLTLTGTASHTGLTSITGGSTLSLGDGGTSGSVAGDILNDATLVIERSDAFTYAGVLSGTGDLLHRGSGTTTLTGNSGAYGGAVVVEAGALRIGSGGVLGTSGLTVGPNGTLGGLGQIVGDVAVNGRLAPGADTLGALSVTGGVTFDPNSTFGVRIASDGANDSLAVTGAAAVAGGVEVTAIDAATSYVDGQAYTILTATGGVNSTFAGASMLNHSAFLTPTLTHNANDVVLNIAVTADFTTVAETFNQFQASSALNDLEQSGDALAVFNAVAGLDAASARRAFDLSSGEIHASGQHVIDQSFALFSRTLRGQGAAGLGLGGAGGQVFTAPLGYSQTPRPASLPSGIMAADTPDLPVDAYYTDTRVSQAWLAPLGGRGTIDGDGNAAGLDWWSAGIAGGYEGAIDVAQGNAFAGFGLGYIRSHGSVDDRLSQFDADGFHVGLYGGWADGPLSLAGSLAYAANRIETERRIVFGGLDRTAEADYWSHTIGFSGEALYGFELVAGTTLSPLVTLDAGWSGHNGFTETGAGALNLTGASESWTRLDTGLGIALSHVVLTDSGTVTFDGRAVWEHAFADVVPSRNLSFAGSPTGFIVNGPAASRDRLRLGAGIAFQATDDLTIRATYDGTFSANQQSHTASVGLGIRF